MYNSKCIYLHCLFVRVYIIILLSLYKRAIIRHASVQQTNFPEHLHNPKRIILRG